MAVLLNSASSASNPPLLRCKSRCRRRRRPYGFLSDVRNFPSTRALLRSVSAIPEWRTRRSSNPDTTARTPEQRLNDAFRSLERSVETSGRRPDATQATQLLYDLCKANKMKKAIRVMEMMASSEVIPDAASYTYLVSQLCKRGNIGHAMQLVERMDELGIPTNTATYNSLVRGLCLHGKLSKSLQLLDRLMGRRRGGGGLVPNAFTYTFLLEAAYKERGADEAIRLLDVIVAKGGKPNLVSYNVLLTGLCKEGNTDKAMRLLRDLPAKGFTPNVVSYNILLRNLCNEGRWHEANQLLTEMDGGDRSPSIVTYNILISSLAFHGKIDQAMEVLEEMEGKGTFKATATSYNPIISQLCKEGKVDQVVQCLDQMIFYRCSPNDGTYNAIAVLCNEDNNRVREAFSIIQSLGSKRGSTMHNFYRHVISSLCRKGNTYPAFRLLYEMVKNGFCPDSYTYSSLIRGLCLEGMLEEAIRIFEVMEESDYRPEVENFNALILGLCKSGRTDLGLNVYGAMIDKGRMPNEMTYTIIVEGIAHEEADIAAEVLSELYLRNVVSHSTMERLVMQYDLQGVLI
ncbi:hypothetical protein SAY86_012672 [Trapa natans]|uniref:Pentatricopeptide repeat-containing protein n=1 Tax=Trapa natans TaxID=22666 RepID=A0AAN7MD34_TRANT|nr:hypothetical protein SAY86_012672 [Trapa natans]